MLKSVEMEPSGRRIGGTKGEAGGRGDARVAPSNFKSLLVEHRHLLLLSSLSPVDLASALPQTQSTPSSL